MNSISADSRAEPKAAAPGRPSIWGWLLRAVGRMWFRQDAALAQRGREERVFLRLALEGAREALPLILHACGPTLVANGATLTQAHLPADTLLLSWPAGPGEQQVLAAYSQVQASLQRARPQAQLSGAASVGWVSVRAASPGGQPYRGEVLRQVAGIGRESEKLGSGLLISAALHHRLDQAAPFNYQLHLALKLAGHRYPATLYQVMADKYC